MESRQSARSKRLFPHPVKTRVLTEFGFRPVLMNQEEIWEAEGLKTGWPWLRWGREPIDRSEADWARRYSVIFRRDDH